MTDSEITALADAAACRVTDGTFWRDLPLLCDEAIARGRERDEARAEVALPRARIAALATRYAGER